MKPEHREHREHDQHPSKHHPSYAAQVSCSTSLHTPEAVHFSSNLLPVAWCNDNPVAQTYCVTTQAPPSWHEGSQVPWAVRNVLRWKKNRHEHSQTLRLP